MTVHASTVTRPHPHRARALRSLHHTPPWGPTKPPAYTTHPPARPLPHSPPTCSPPSTQPTHPHARPPRNPPTCSPPPTQPTYLLAPSHTAHPHHALPTTPPPTQPTHLLAQVLRVSGVAVQLLIAHVAQPAAPHLVGQRHGQRGHAAGAGAGHVPDGQRVACVSRAACRLRR